MSTRVVQQRQIFAAYATAALAVAAFAVLAPSGVAAQSAQPDSSCCTAAAMKTLAAEAGAVDMVGIKLGMSPQQATAAIKAHNPALRVYQVNMRLTQPGAKNFVEVPHYIVATNNPVGKTLPVGQEVILLEFTTPPNSPVVAIASRYTNFAPTLASNLLSELDKKYGPEYPGLGPRMWVYDASGKPVTTESKAIDSCAVGVYSPLGAAPFSANLGVPSEGSYLGTLDVTTYKNAVSGATAPTAACVPYTVVRSLTLYSSTPPDSQLQQITMTMSSGGLTYASIRSTGEWLQAAADAKAKAEHDAAAKSTGTSF